MKCGICGGAEMMEGTFNVSYIFKGQETKISITGQKCPMCGEVTMSLPESDRFQDKMDEFKATVNAEFIDPLFIVNVRKN